MRRSPLSRVSASTGLAFHSGVRGDHIRIRTTGTRGRGRTDSRRRRRKRSVQVGVARRACIVVGTSTCVAAWNCRICERGGGGGGSVAVVGGSGAVIVGCLQISTIIVGMTV